MTSLHPSKLIVIIACLAIITTYTIPSTAFSSAQEVEWYAEPLQTTDQTYTDLVATPLYISSFATSNPTGYSPSQIKTAYNLPSSGGAGTTIAIIVAYHAPALLTDYTAFCHEYDLPDNSSSNLIVHTMPGATVNNTWTPETCLDVEWTHAIAPNATILLVEAVDNRVSSLFNAIIYANSQSDISAISMSWGLDESLLTADDENYLDNFFTVPNIVYFAASGDSGAGTMYPAVSTNVVAVGGTKLSLTSEGNVISETAWSGSGGGVSIYENMPTYQVSYGLTGTKRCVPDVSYNADPSTGFSVYCNGEWHTYGGTSAGAPQWAAIHAIGASASNDNLYTKAKTAYSTYFRDIISGSNGYPAKEGYDYVTGLGSPLTCNFNYRLNVSPSFGATGTTITLTGTGLSGNSANISYLNPITSLWVSLSNNTSVVSGNLTYATNAPDLMQNNPSGDNPASYDSIVYHVIDDSGESYNTTVPFMLFRRGLTQVGASTATGLYGNNTFFGTDIFIRNGDALTVSGNWFSPGNATLYWDNTETGNLIIAQDGSFTTSVTIPVSTSDIHIFTLQDNTTTFCVNITISPLITTDYSETWHTSDFSITLSADATVNEIYYRINGGETQNVTINGYPTITTQAANNTLEYWCNWTFAEATIGTPHQILLDIKLDKTAAMGSIMTNPTTTSRTITLYLSAVDSVSGVSEMCFSNDASIWSDWEPYADSKTWTLTSGEGSKMVCVQFKNGAGIVSPLESCEVTLEVEAATTAPQATSSATTNPATTSTSTPTDEPSPTPVPELSVSAALSVFVVASLLIVFLAKKRSPNTRLLNICL